MDHRPDIVMRAEDISMRFLAHWRSIASITLFIAAKLTSLLAKMGPVNQR